mmetsp:Transcript_15220/g.24722  ORF Transcript_15220/g.24722 Transcript_15220/m.24722 type:complete len:117 (-) Transcript_15220:307-657(-)
MKIQITHAANKTKITLARQLILGHVFIACKASNPKNNSVYTIVNELTNHNAKLSALLQLTELDGKAFCSISHVQLSHCQVITPGLQNANRNLSLSMPGRSLAYRQRRGSPITNHPR